VAAQNLIKEIREGKRVPDFSERPLSYSTLKAFDDSPLHFCYNWYTKRAKSDALIEGGAFDTMLFEPKSFDARYSVEPDVDRRTTEGKKVYDAWEADVVAKSLDILSPSQKLKIDLWIDAVKQSTDAQALLAGMTDVQIRLNWTHRSTGLPIINVLDGKGDECIIEAKTAVSAEKEQFAKDGYYWDYPLQAGLYSQGYVHVYGEIPKRYYYLVVEKSAPFSVSVLRATPEWLKYGRLKAERLLNLIRHCEQEGLWAMGREFHLMYGNNNLDLPGWAKKKMEEIELWME